MRAPRDVHCPTRFSARVSGPTHPGLQTHPYTVRYTPPILWHREGCLGASGMNRKALPSALNYPKEGCPTAGSRGRWQSAQWCPRRAAGLLSTSQCFGPEVRAGKQRGETLWPRGGATGAGRLQIPCSGSRALEEAGPQPMGQKTCAPSDRSPGGRRPSLRGAGERRGLRFTATLWVRPDNYRKTLYPGGLLGVQQAGRPAEGLGLLGAPPASWMASQHLGDQGCRVRGWGSEGVPCIFPGKVPLKHRGLF